MVRITFNQKNCNPTETANKYNKTFTFISFSINEAKHYNATKIDALNKEQYYWKIAIKSCKGTFRSSSQTATRFSHLRSVGPFYLLFSLIIFSNIPKFIFVV